MKGVTKYSGPKDLFNLFDDMFFNARTVPSFSQPSVNVKENDDSFLLELAAPGLNKGDFDINVEHDQLILSAQKEQSEEEKGENYHRREFNFTSFKRSFHLDDTIDREGIEANYVDGVLTVVLPKKEEVRKEVKRIEIK